jgi:hypothetical protein
MKGHRGKIKIKAQTFLMPGRNKIDASVYIHVKGYARARVSHLDIEKMGLGKVIHRGRGNFLLIKGIKQGLEVTLRESRELEIDGKKAMVSNIIVVSPLLNNVLEEGKSTRAWVGRKYDGVYVGFRKEEMEKLEKVASERFGIMPLKKLEKPPLGLG